MGGAGYDVDGLTLAAASFQRDQQTAEAFPLLSTFFEHQEQLRAVRGLPQFLHWLELLMERFDNSIDHAAARQLSVAAVLAQIPAAQLGEWQGAFSPGR